MFFGSSSHSFLVQVEEYCEEMGEGARVVLVPSYRDAHHDCIFPQVIEHFNAKTGFLAVLTNSTLRLFATVLLAIQPTYP
jgi:hypothetical protein